MRSVCETDKLSYETLSVDELNLFCINPYKSTDFSDHQQHAQNEAYIGQMVYNRRSQKLGESS